MMQPSVVVVDGQRIDLTDIRRDCNSPSDTPICYARSQMGKQAYKLMTSGSNTFSFGSRSRLEGQRGSCNAQDL